MTEADGLDEQSKLDGQGIGRSGNWTNLELDGRELGETDWTESKIAAFFGLAANAGCACAGGVCLRKRRVPGAEVAFSGERHVPLGI